MKKINIIATAILITVGFSSCFNKVEELFDESSAERLAAKTKECRQLLVDAQYGWNIRYYPSTTREFGGTNFVAKFDSNGYVSVSGEIAPDVTKFVTSKYELTNFQSVVLDFVTYNDYIHYWSDPDGTLENTFGGDSQWQYIEGSKDKIVFKGLRTRNTIVFEALQEEMLPAIKKIVNVKDEAFLNISYYWDDGSNEGFTLYVDDDYSVLFYGSETDPTVIPFAYTDTGIMFYTPTEINGVIFNEFIYDVATHLFTSVDAKDKAGQPVTIEWHGEYTSELIPYESFLGTWVIHYTMSNSSLTKTVQMVKRQNNRSYTLKGLYADLVVYYDRVTAPQLYVQTVDSFNGIKFCMWDNVSGEHSTSESDGVFLNYTSSGSETKITLSEIKEGFSTTGFLFKNEYTGNDQLQDIPNIEYLIKQ